MCGVIGAYIKDANEQILSLVKKICIESKIRGMHAFGVSYFQKGKIHTIKENGSSEEFFKNHSMKDFVNEDGSLKFIAHCRYSTSDLDWNQPISNDRISVVHNGVITQEDHSVWNEKYDYEFKTKNDSEMILMCNEKNKDVKFTFEDSSIAMIQLNVDGSLESYRNGKRPLYYSNPDYDCHLIASTENIFQRSGITSIQSIEFSKDKILKINNEFEAKWCVYLDENKKDYQQ